MVSPATQVVAALQSFGARADDATISALRTLAFIALREALEAVKRGAYAKAQEAAFAALQTIEALDQLTRSDA